MLQTSFIGAYAAPAKLKLLALRETPAYRVSTDPSSCTNVELLSAVVGGPKQIEIAESILAHLTATCT